MSADTQTPSLQTVLTAIDDLWPLGLTESWDRTGLVVGRRDQPVRRILVAVDPVADVIDEAIAGEYDLLVTHHPLLLKGVHAVTDETYKGELITRLIEARCALITAHTNADQPEGGVSHLLGEILGLRDLRALSPAAGQDQPVGIGRVGSLPEPMTLAAFSHRVAASLPAVAGGIRVAGDPEGLVSTVALCGGAGDSLFAEVRASGADVYVTSDLRHHPASEAREESRGGRPYLIDVAHFASEWPWVPFAAEALKRSLHSAGWSADVQGSELVTDPWDFVLMPR
jgi:dinuclear metal center YbgI/SA1388 family protein